MKLSKHSKERMKERANVTAHQKAFFRNALDYGVSAGEIKDDSLKQKLKSREKYNSKVKLYKGWVFVYSKNSHQLYTMYKLEEI